MSAATSNPQQHTPLPYAELCSIFTDLLDTPIIVSAFDYARDHMPHTIFNHVTRSWIFATKVAAARGEVFDAEVVAVSTQAPAAGFRVGSSRSNGASARDR